MASADTNLLVRLFLDLDERQSARAVRAAVDGVWVSHVVLHEFVWVSVSVYRRAHLDVGALIEQLLVHQSVVLEEPTVVRAALERFRNTPRLGFNDCLVLEIARARGKLPLQTFDRDLAKQEGAELV